VALLERSSVPANTKRKDILMKRLVLAALVAALACAFAATAASAAPVTVHQDPFDAQVTICNGDTVDLTGTLVVVLNGNAAITNTHTLNLVGIDETTGTVYHGEQSYLDIQPPDSSGGGGETLRTTMVLAAPGAPTFRVMGHFHITVLPDGTIAVIFATDTTTCT
jgi:hypothetical protein